MFFLLSKVLDLLFGPLTWALLLGGAGAWELSRHRRHGARMLLGALGILLVFSSGPVANGLTVWAESGAPRTYEAGTTYDALIILGGALDPEGTLAAGHPEYNQAVDRILMGFRLLHQARAREVLISGGEAFHLPGATPEADVLKAQLEDFGIPAARIFVEDRSRNTHENAVNSRPIILVHGWKRLLLVTSAAHIPRALGCFHAAGLFPDTYPVDFRGTLHFRGPFSLLPRVGNLAQSTEMLRELAGRWVYRLRGFSSG